MFMPPPFWVGNRYTVVLSFFGHTRGSDNIFVQIRILYLHLNPPFIWSSLLDVCFYPFPLWWVCAHKYEQHQKPWF